MFGGAIALLTMRGQEAYLDNIMVWTGDGDEPTDKTSPLLQPDFDMGTPEETPDEGDSSSPEITPPEDTDDNTESKYKKYITLSFDDGIEQDEKVIEILQKYGFSGATFFLNTGAFGSTGTLLDGTVQYNRFTESEAKSVYANYDVQAHGYQHLALNNLSEAAVTTQINNDVNKINALFGSTTVGMAYPGMNEYTQTTIKYILDNTPVRFARTVNSTGNFNFPTNFMEWNPTAGLGNIDNCLAKANEFINADATEDMLLYIWGHSYELDQHSTWDKFDTLIKTLAEAAESDSSICIVTNGEFYELFGGEGGKIDSYYTLSESTIQFTSMSPANGASVQLANDTIQNYYNDYNASFDFTGYTIGEDSYYPDNLKLSWTVSEPANSYDLYISQNSDMSDSQKYTLTSTNYTHKTLLYGEQYYWKVVANYDNSETVESDVISFSTLEGIRALEIPDVSNTRDIGGWTTVDGYRVKQGMVYRGAALDESRSDLTEAGRLFMVDELGIKTELDLRGETTAGNSPLGSDIAVVSAYAPYYDAVGNNREPGAAGPFVDDGSKQYTTNFYNLFRAFANSNNYPIYVHCSIGRDRTGTMIFILNGLLGVSEDDLLQDYYMSMLSSAAGANYEGCKESIESLVTYFKNYGDSTLQENIEEYLIDLGISTTEIENIRRNLLEGYKDSQTVTFTNASPASGDTVQVANSYVQTYYNTFNATTSDVTYSPIFTTGNDSLVYPKGATFKWNVGVSATKYILYVSLNKDMSDSEKYELTSPSYTHKSLMYGKQYYWKVEAYTSAGTSAVAQSPVYTFTTAEGIRALQVDNMSNVRDMGGWTTTSGQRVKQGMVYRGGQLESLSINGGTTAITQSGIDYMRNVLGIKTDLDLRGGSQTSTLLGSDVKVISFPESTPYYGHNHETAITDSEKQKLLKTEIEAFADASNYPMYVHCSLGRDRTGTLIFLINGLLGVSEADLRKDYWFSVHSLAGYHETSKLSQLQGNIDSLFTYINTFSGSTFQKKIETFLLSIGVSSSDISAIRSLLLEDAAAADYAKEEIPYGFSVTGSEAYPCETFEMLTEAEAAAAGVPTGYSGHVLKMTGGSSGGVGVMIDPTDLKIHRDDLDSIVFRVYFPEGTADDELRVFIDGGYRVQVSPSSREKWIEVTVSADANDHFYDSDDYLKPFCLVFRLKAYVDCNVYVDSVTFNLK